MCLIRFYQNISSARIFSFTTPTLSLAGAWRLNSNKIERSLRSKKQAVSKLPNWYCHCSVGDFSSYSEQLNQECKILWYLNWTDFFRNEACLNTKPYSRWLFSVDRAQTGVFTRLVWPVLQYWQHSITLPPHLATRNWINSNDSELRK